MEITWDTPSHDASGSMPLGNGDIGVNAWVEQDGDLLLYLSKTDAWDESAQLLKLGRVRLALQPNPFRAGLPFYQTLNTSDATICIEAGSGSETVHIRLWVDANRPVVRVEVDAASPIQAQATVELWRTAARDRAVREAHSSAGARSAGACERVYPDTRLPSADDNVVWCHRNRTSCWAATLEHQHVASWIAGGLDPLLNRTFGALMRGDGLAGDGAGALRTGAPARVTLSIHPLTAQTATPDEWVQQVQAQAARSDAVLLDTAFAEHVAWWRAFWQRSWIHATGSPDAEAVTQAYEFQRFIDACAGRGAFPIKFNGSIFTVDWPVRNETFDADYRRWGGGYWAQNTRLTYWPMIMSGDFDLMEPWFRMHVDALPLATARVKAGFSIDDAAMFPEVMTFWGTFLNRHYGFDRGDLEHGVSENRYIRRHWQGMLELLAVLLDAYATSQDEALLRDKLMVLAPPMLRFYRTYYQRRDHDGKMLFTPAQALETWWEAVNPLPDIAGLKWVLQGLLELPARAVPPALRSEWTEFLALLPDLPTRTSGEPKRKELVPALEYQDEQNCENPALYAVFPYRFFGVGKPDLEVALAAWETRQRRETSGWCQDSIQAALMGLTEDARAAVVTHATWPHEASRLSFFWWPGVDWIPDSDHGAVTMIALQRMLMQADDGKIMLLPAWPKDWDADFRLHAPGRTVVEGKVAQGRLTELHVTPESRRKDVVILS